MAPLTRALHTEFVENRGDVKIYSANVDKAWTVAAVPQGGYVLGLIVNACIARQSETSHPDIIHVMCQFIRATSIAPCEVHIRTIRSGKFNSNLTAELLQNGEVRISAQLIFKARSTGTEHPRLTLAPPSPFARRIPIHLHPSIASLSPMYGIVNFRDQIRWAEDKAIRERNYALGRGETLSLGGGGLEWGAWLELTDPTECLNSSMLPFMGDMIKDLPELLPKDQRPPPGWHPTMAFTLEFKAKIPDDPSFSKRTVGLYARSTFLQEGRHDAYVEIWTAPSDINQGFEIEGWRDKQICLAVAHQMALIVPMEVNMRKASEANSSFKL